MEKEIPRFVSTSNYGFLCWVFFSLTSGRSCLFAAIFYLSALKWIIVNLYQS